MPGVAVGKQIVLPADGSTYTLYFVFPLTSRRTRSAWSPGR